MSSFTVQGEKFKDVYPEILSTILEWGQPSSPRGQPIIERLNFSFIVRDVSDPWTYSAARKLNYRFGVAEGLLNIHGFYDPQIILPINSKMALFQNEAGSWDGNYPLRMQGWIPFVIKLLQTDPDSRRAVIPVYGPLDLKEESKDICCTENLQFLIRQGKLHMIVNMRSNDALLGTANDVVQFMLLQNFVASCLGIPTGTYYHNAGSMHIYERDLEKVKAIIEEYELSLKDPHQPGTVRMRTFPAFPVKMDYEEAKQQVDTVIAAAKAWNNNPTTTTPALESPFFDFYQILTKTYNETV